MEKVKAKYAFLLRSKTNGGNCSRIHTMVFEKNWILIRKQIFTPDEEDNSKDFTKLWSRFGKTLWEQRISFKTESFLGIANYIVNKEL